MPVWFLFPTPIAQPSWTEGNTHFQSQKFVVVMRNVNLFIIQIISYES